MNAIIADNADPFSPVRAELAAWREAGHVARLWLRDDDAMAPSDALERLLMLVNAHHMPLLLAAIPMRAETSLAQRLAPEKLVDVAMHGIWHRNHADSDEKSQETPLLRGLDHLTGEFEEARARLLELFGAVAGSWYVPPWNRISPDVAALLPALGFKALSTFGRSGHGIENLAQLNCHVDLIDWHGGRKGRGASWVATELAAALAASRLGDKAPVGLLSHHLDHDETTWSVLEQLGPLFSQNPAARWVSATDALL